MLIQAAGLEPNRPVKITNDIFRRDIESHLDQHIAPALGPMKPWPKIVAVGDMHEPFCMTNAKADLVTFIARKKPEWVVQIGDAFDMYSHAKFPRSHNVFTPKEEERIARKNLEEFWREVRKASPGVKCVQLLGNHDMRPLKRVLEALPSLEHWAEAYLKDLMSFDGVQTVMDSREIFQIGDIGFHHGYKSKLGDHRDDVQGNMIVGHTHRMGVVYRPYRDQIFFEANTGYLGDPTAKGLTYTPTRVTNWTWGWLDVDEDGPKPVPWRRRS